MGLRYPDQNSGFCFFVTTTFVHRQRHGNKHDVYEALCDSLEHYAAAYQARVAGYVLMPSHLHAVVFIEGTKLASFMRDFKKFTSQKSLPELGVNALPVCMPRYDRVRIETEEVLRIKLDYIHQNPVTAGLVTRTELWRWSSAGDYVLDRPGPVTVWKEWA